MSLPVNDEVLLGELLNGTHDFQSVAAVLPLNHFANPVHRLIFERMLDVHDDGQSVDRVTVANELMKHNELEACGGLTYLVGLGDAATADIVDGFELPEIGDVLEIEGNQYVVTTVHQSIARRIDRQTDGGNLDIFMNTHPDYRFVQVVS